MTKIISFLITLILLFESVPMIGQKTLKVDAGNILGETTTKATGFLYGLAEKEVPSSAITDALKISSVSQKVPDGLQHPTGDIDHIQDQLDSCDYIVTYLQDSFDTWYYCHKEIMDKRAAGTYDWKDFLYNRYLPIVEEKVKHIESQPYSDRIVYCIFNECDNAIWFGNYADKNPNDNEGPVCHYDEIGRQNFYEAWKITYDLVKSIAPDAKIGGPGFCDYETTKIDGFMKYTSENNCVPEIMIWHELAYWSIPDWHLHYEDYRRIEKQYGVTELDIIVTEYGEPEECGNPSDMIHYIIAMEKTGIWGNMAYWRLSNNLNDTTADDNSPNSNWWLYRKYAEMKGQQRLDVKSKSMNEYNPKDRLDGLASLTNDNGSINMLVTGSDKKFTVKIDNLDKTNLGDKVNVKIETVYYEGLTGIVSSPILLRQYNTKANFDRLNIPVPATDKDAVYFITVTPEKAGAEPYRNTNIPKRYEFEDGKLRGNSYTYDSWYATTGDQAGMTGGYENDGDGVKLSFTVNKKGTYDLDIIFGKHNDSGIPQGRDYAKVKMIIDGEVEIIKLENTIKSECTTSKTITKDLSVGIHTIEFYHDDGTFVLDSMLVSRHEDKEEISVLRDGDNKYIAIAPYDGYYKIISDTAGEIDIDGAHGSVQGGDTVYLRRGANAITFDGELTIVKTDDKAFTQTIKAKDITLSGKAQLLTDKYGVRYIDNISNLSGKAEFNVNVPADGDYRVTLLYANNSEGGVHDYNVDLIERYATVTANGESKDVFTRNTFSKYTYKTMTFNLTLKEGNNTVSITNSGNYIFHNMQTFAPQIAEITINAVTN